MALALFAGICVTDHDAAVAWYSKLFGAEPSFVAHPKESVWELAEDRSVYVEEQPEHAGHAELTVFVDDLDAFVTAASAQGIEPAETETYGNGVRKVTYEDADGNQIGFGGAPLA
jgi:uncharacterized glyoxalase superfamily protein PhnB